MTIEKAIKQLNQAIEESTLNSSFTGYGTNVKLDTDFVKDLLNLLKKYSSKNKYKNETPPNPNPDYEPPMPDLDTKPIPIPNYIPPATAKRNVVKVELKCNHELRRLAYNTGGELYSQLYDFGDVEQKDTFIPLYCAKCGQMFVGKYPNESDEK